MSRGRLASAAVLLAGTALAARQTPVPGPQPPTFRVQVDYVEVDALVTDKTGTFIRDLTKEDFQVFEDGQPQAVTAFSMVDIPVERAPRTKGSALPVEPDVTSNERPFDGRVYVLVIDDLHTSVGRSTRVRSAARQFIEQNLGANDLMAVVHTSGPTDASQSFTSNKRLLEAAVDKTTGRKLVSPTAGLTREYNRGRDHRDPGDPLIDPEDRERDQNARSMLDTLRRVSDWFGGVHGRRKTILLVSEGIDYDMNVFADNGASSTVSTTRNNVLANRGPSPILDATRDAVAAAARANVAIYGIDPRGTANLGDEDIETQTYPDEASSSATISMAQGLHIGPQSLGSDLNRSQDSLRTLAEDTGGFAAVNRNDFTSAFDRIVQDNSSYYVLAYYPPAARKRDGAFHKIEVRVSRPGTTVRARQGYAAPKGKPAMAPANPSGAPVPDVRDALQSPLPVSGLAMRVFAAPFKGAAPNASVVLGVELLGRTLSLAPDNHVELSFMAVDAWGRVRSRGSETLTLRLSGEMKQRVAQTGIRQLNRIDLPPGRYQLRVAAHDSGGGAIGSVIYDLDVPDFTRNPLNMSGLALTSTSSWQLPTTRPDPQLSGVLPGPPIALRAFPADDELAIFAEVYDNAASPPHKVAVTTTITSEDGTVVLQTDEERTSTDLQGKRGGYKYEARIPLHDLAPGAYVLKVEARVPSGQGATAAREVPFTVGVSR